MDKIEIAIVDDHQLFRDGLASMLARHDDFEVSINVGRGKELMEELSSGSTPDVLLLDLTMPDMTGFEVLKEIKKKYPDIKTIVLSMHDDGNYIVRCVREGAFGYLLKNMDEDELIKAIYTVCNNKKYFNEEISNRMINIMSIEGTATKKLSSKETEILSLISEGHTTKEIADQLFISTRTVETHRVNMMKKLAVKNSAELIKKAVKLKLI
ncbi:MAG: response regulator transcription factor [Cyclobacteriaceae bacterium]